MEINSEKLIEMASFAINRGNAEGMDGSYVNANTQRVFSTRFANSAIHQNFTDIQTKFEVAVIKGLKRATTFTNSLKESHVAWAVDQAIDLIRFLPDDPEFPGVLTEPQKYPNLLLTDPTMKNLTPSDVADKVISGINAGHECSKKIQTVSGNLNIKDGITLFQSSEGLENVTPITEIAATINIMADDGSGESRSNSSFGGRRFSELLIESEAEKVAKRSLLGLRPQEIELKDYPVILDFQAAADQIFGLSLSLSAKHVLDQLSFLKDKVGEQVFAESLTLINDPHDPNSLSSRPSDMEGVASQQFTLIEHGVIKNFAHNRLTAMKMDTKSNGCGYHFYGAPLPLPFAIKVNPGQKSKDQLIAEMDHGLLLTNLHYTNYIDLPRGTETGMTKDGVFIIKNGEIAGAAKNMRFTDNFQHLFSQMELSRETFQPVTWLEMALTVPAIKINSMNFSSKTTH